MSKNISLIVNGAQTRYYNVPKINISQAEDRKRVSWIPEDEANDYADTDTLSVTEDGTYTPDDDVVGFSEVDVNVEGAEYNLTTLSITENGSYTPEGNYDGFASVSVNIEWSKFHRAWLDLLFKDMKNKDFAVVEAGETKYFWLPYRYDATSNPNHDKYYRVTVIAGTAPVYCFQIIADDAANPWQGSMYFSTDNAAVVKDNARHVPAVWKEYGDMTMADIDTRNVNTAFMTYPWANLNKQLYYTAVQNDYAETDLQYIDEDEMPVILNSNAVWKFSDSYTDYDWDNGVWNIVMCLENILIDETQNT